MIGEETPDVNLKYQSLCELALFYSAGNVGVFPSRDEPFGITFIECTVCGGRRAIGANTDGSKDTGLATGVLLDVSTQSMRITIRKTRTM